MTERIKVTIDRKRWLRGEGPDDSYLLRERDGKMCCLGFCALATGLTPELIAGTRTPHAGELVNFVDGAGPLARAAKIDVYMTNDMPEHTEAEREDRLTTLLGNAGFDVEFVDG